MLPFFKKFFRKIREFSDLLKKKKKKIIVKSIRLNYFKIEV